MSPRNALAAKRYIIHGGMQPTIEPSGHPDSAAPATKRRLPATTLPDYRESRRGWGLLSALLHVLVIALLLTPIATHTGDVTEKPQGAGGLGPAGGGGGGRRGTGDAPQVRSVRVEPVPAQTPQAVTPPPTPP